MKHFGLINTIRFLLCGFSCLLLIGCGSSKPKRVSVTGAVNYNGQPLSNGEVVFVPMDLNMGFRARGKADTHGRFKLTTFDENDGAVPGEYKITVFAYRQLDSKADSHRIAPRAGEPAVPQKYFDQHTTDLKATVGPGATVVQLELKD